MECLKPKTSKWSGTLNIFIEIKVVCLANEPSLSQSALETEITDHERKKTTVHLYNYNFLVYASNDQATLDKMMLSTNITKVGYCGIDEWSSLYAKQKTITQITTFKGMVMSLERKL